MDNNENQKFSDMDKTLNLLNERVIRWDSYRINHFSFTTNLIFTLNLGFIGFIVSQISYDLTSNFYFSTLLIISFICLATSFYIGLFSIFNRLNDFRLTSKLTKLKKDLFEHENKISLHPDFKNIQFEILSLSNQTKKLGLKTWSLLKFQIWFFIIGTTFGIIIFIISKVS